MEYCSCLINLCSVLIFNSPHIFSHRYKISVIIETTLECLDVSLLFNFDRLKLFELRTMTKLKTLIGTGLAPVKEQLMGYLPNLVIYEFDNVHEHCEFTCSSAGNISDSDGIWEIKAKQLKLFKKSNAFNNGIL